MGRLCGKQVAGPARAPLPPGTLPWRGHASQSQRERRSNEFLNSLMPAGAAAGLSGVARKNIDLKIQIQRRNQYVPLPPVLGFETYEKGQISQQRHPS